MSPFPTRRILVPADFSRPSFAALDAAKALARRWGSSLDLVYVQSAPLPLVGFGADGEALGAPELVKEMEEFRQWRKDRLARAAAGLPAGRVRIHALTGWAAGEILRLSEARGVGLVVMGTHGHTGAGRVVFGSAAETVVRRSRRPVLTVHEGTKLPRVRRILAPCVPEAYSDRALRAAAAFARACGASLTVFRVVPEDPETERLIFARRVAKVLGASARLARVAATVGEDPRRAILEEAVAGGYDLVALSSHRRPLLKMLAMGSTAETVLRYCPIPVLSIP
jgi:universal stress protein A